MTNDNSHIIRKEPSLYQLLRRIIWSFTLVIIGSWAIIIQRLNIIHLEGVGATDQFWFYFDLVSLGLALFGIFMVFYHNSKLTPRLRRLERMGESRWGLF
jgi:hypothetical protein